MPTLKAIHICNSHQPKRKPKIAKEYVFSNADKNTCKRMKIKTKEEHRTHNSTYTQVGVQCFYESEVLNPSSVLLLKFRAKNPHLRVGANRCTQPY